MEYSWWIGSGLMVTSTFIAAFSQILLKKSAKKTYDTWWKAYINASVISAYSLFVGTTILSVFALKFIPMTLCAAFGATGQVFVPLLSFFILHEKISRRTLEGMTIILLGVLVFSL